MAMLDNAVLFDPRGLRDPGTEGALDDAGQMRVLPFSFWQQFSQAEIAVFCHRQAVYCVPTEELVTWLAQEIGERKAVEIGAGTGILAGALNIQATDNWLQTWPDVAAMYQSSGQPTIQYGSNVVKLDAELALSRFRPEVVLAAWVTHKWKPSEAWREGNMHGVDERKVVRQADYVFVGHDHVHRHKPIMAMPHETHYFPWLVSRATSPGRNYIKIWRRQR